MKVLGGALRVETSWCDVWEELESKGAQLSTLYGGFFVFRYLARVSEGDGEI
jgi:hypothetical protein